jgi:hypothetical protein
MALRIGDKMARLTEKELREIASHTVDNINYWMIEKLEIVTNNSFLDTEKLIKEWATLALLRDKICEKFELWPDGTLK